MKKYIFSLLFCMSANFGMEPKNPELKKIPVSPFKSEMIDINKEEPTSKKTFKELIGSGELTTLVRVGLLVKQKEETARGVIYLNGSQNTFDLDNILARLKITTPSYNVVSRHYFKYDTEAEEFSLSSFFLDQKLFESQKDSGSTFVDV